MTAIVGFADGQSVWIGGDSAGVAGHQLSVRADEKVFKVGEFLVGFTSSFRMGQLLRHGWVPPLPNVVRNGERIVDQDVSEFLATKFIDAVRARLKEGGFAERDKEVERGGYFVLGFRGRLFSVMSDYQVAEFADPYAAAGCGEDIALGAMFATREMKDPEARIRIALEAAERHSAYVRGPFVVKSIGPQA